MFDLFFGWPAGAVWPNLVASVVTFSCGLLWARRSVVRKFEEQLRLNREHTQRQLDEHHAKLMERLNKVSVLAERGRERKIV